MEKTSLMNPIPEPYVTVMRRIRRAYIQVLAHDPCNQLFAIQLNLSDSDLLAIGSWDRSSVGRWYDQHKKKITRDVIDFCAICGEGELKWSNEDHECIFNAAMTSGRGNVWESRKGYQERLCIR